MEEKPMPLSTLDDKHVPKGKAYCFWGLNLSHLLCSAVTF